MMPETEASLQAELGRTERMLASMDDQITQLSGRSPRSPADDALLASLREQRGRLQGGLDDVRRRLAALKPA